LTNLICILRPAWLHWVNWKTGGTVNVLQTA
jgi:hypothetical protein